MSLNQKQRKMLDKKRLALDKVGNAIYESAGSPNIPFNDCYKLAPQELKEKYSLALSDLYAYYGELVSLGKGWFDNGRFREN